MRNSWFLRTLATVLLVVTALNALRPMISYRALEIGASPAQLGFIAAGYAALAFFAAVPVGRLVDRVGEMRFIVAGTTGLAVVALALTGANSVVALIAAHAAVGLGQVLAFVGMQSLLTSGGDVDAFDGRYGMFAALASVGQIVGPAAGGFVAERSGNGTDAVFVMSMFIALAAAVFAVSLWVRPPDNHRDHAASDQPRGTVTVRRLLAHPGMPQGIFASLAVLASIDILIAYLPAYGERHAIPVATVGLLLATRAATSLASRLFMVQMIRWLGRRVLLAGSIFVTAAALAVLPLFGATLAPLFLLLAISGVGLGLAQPMTMSWVAATAPVTERATALSVRISGNRLGQLVLPAAVGVVAGAAGVSFIFVMLGIVLTASAAAVSTAHFVSEYENA